MRKWVAGAAVVMLLVGVGCGRTPLPCGPQTCDGCCDATGVCQAGDAPSACGQQGLSCAQCVSCPNRLCNGQALTGGGAAASGGGTAASGGGANVSGGGSGLTGGGTGVTGGGAAEVGGGSGQTGGSGVIGGGSAIPVPLTRVDPALVLVVDNSGSMSLPANPNDMMCVPGCGTQFPCPPGCRTRSTAVKEAVGTLTTDLATSAMVGAVVFPSTGAEACGVPAVRVNLTAATDDTSERLNADRVAMAVRALTPGGGTPTTAALNLVSTLTLTSMPQRETFAVLITDGIPNCNATNPQNNCGGTQMCQCTIGTSSTNCSGQFCATGCTDNTASSAALSLAQSGIQTMVVGVGRDVAAMSTLSLLSTMALNGQLPRACGQPGLTCGMGGLCSGSTCTRGVYTLDNANETQVTLNAIRRHAAELRACHLRVDPVQLPSHLVMNGAEIPTGTGGWLFDPTGEHVVIEGTWCDQAIATGAMPQGFR